MATYNTLDPTSNTEPDDTYLLMQNGVNRLQTRGILSASLDQGQWQNSFDYSINDITRGTDSKRYIALESSGPNTANGVVDPETDTSGVWFDCTDILNGTSVPDKATTAQAQAGTDDEAYLTSKTVNDALDMVGFVLYRSVSTPPVGRWIKGNGFEISRTAYADLFAEAEASDNYIDQATKDADPETYAGYYGDGDGSTTFTLPDLRAEFIRGFDDGRGSDSDRGFGSWQKGSFIPGDDGLNNEVVSVYLSGNKTELGWDEFTGYDEVQADTVVVTSPMTLSSIGGFTGHGGASRPRNIAYIAWIRY